MNAQETEQFLTTLAEGLVFPRRAPILKRPDEIGLEYEDVFFAAIDGVPLEGWLMPADSNQLVICNHFGPANRQGYPGHVEPWNTAGGIEVDFLPKYKALHDAGYNVLAYDFRNHGMSGSGAGGRVGNGVIEWRDVIGSIRYARARPETAKMTTHLQSLCMGANATLFAMKRHPEEFEQIASLILLQPLVGSTFVEQVCAPAGIENAVEQFDAILRRMSSFRVADQEVRPYAECVDVPTFVVQVKEDLMSRASDVQEIHDAIPVADKKLFWIEGTPLRHHGYTYFSEHPEQMIEWYDAHS